MQLVRPYFDASACGSLTRGHNGAVTFLCGKLAKFIDPVPSVDA